MIIKGKIVYLHRKVFNNKIMQSTTLSPIQLQLLHMFSYIKNEESLSELKEVLSNYYFQKAEKEVERVWKEKNMSNEMMHELLNAHYRTPYNR